MHPRSVSVGSEGVSSVTSLGSEAAMFFGLLNHTLTWNRPQRFLYDKVVVFTFLTHIIECLIIIATNRWVHCNAYKCPEMSAFVVLFHFHTCDHHEYLLNSEELQNLSSRIELTSSSDSYKSVHLSNSDICDISGVCGRCISNPKLAIY